MHRPLTERPPRVTEPGYRRGKRPANYGRKFPPEVLTADEVFRLLKAPRRGPAGVRNRALIAMLWRSGLRIGEALALYPKDVSLELGVIFVLHGKGDKRRPCGIDRQALALLKIWLDLRAELGVGDDSPIFCKVVGDKRGGAMRPAYVRDALKRYRRDAGIQKRVHPHGFRHTHAFELANENTPLNVIQKQLGHNALWTTEKYIDHLLPSAVVSAMQKRDWPEPGTIEEAGDLLTRIAALVDQ